MVISCAVRWYGFSCAIGTAFQQTGAGAIGTAQIQCHISQGLQYGAVCRRERLRQATSAFLWRNFAGQTGKLLTSDIALKLRKCITSAPTRTQSWFPAFFLVWRCAGAYL